MRLFGSTFLTAVVFLTAACTPDAPNTQLPGPDSCGASALQRLVGKPAKQLETMKFGQTTRFIRPDTAVTMDYSPERLNITIDDAEMIAAVTCG